MSLPTATKIEDRAIGALKNVVDEHVTMGALFNSMDKEMAWDGYIYIFFEGSKGEAKKDLDDKVPVQIKGHVDEKRKYMNKQRITYPVFLEDLQIYFRDRGTLYFQIFMTEDGKKKEIFYSSLFPTKIKTYLELAVRKKNKKTINIAFTKLRQDPEALYQVVKQFSIESKKQGFGEGQIVKNTILLKDMDKVKSISATVVGATNEYDFLRRIKDGDICIYGTIGNSSIELPLEWQGDTKYVIGRIVNRKISVADVVYYDKYEVEVDTDSKFIVIPSPNVQIHFSDKKIDFKARSEIKQLRNDAEFILAMMGNTEVKFGDKAFSYADAKIPKELLDELNFYIDLDEVLKMLEFEYSRPFSEVTGAILNQFVTLVEIKNGLKNKLLQHKLHTYDWKIEDKYLPLIIVKGEREENILINRIYTHTHQTLNTDDNGNYYKVPSFSHIDGNVLGNLFYYDYNYFAEQIRKAEVNDFTVNTLNHASIVIIQAYDLNGDIQLLELAKLLQEKIKNHEQMGDICLINILQIKKRIEKLSEEDKRDLTNITSCDLQILFGISVLLNDLEKAEQIYIKFYYILQLIFK